MQEHTETVHCPACGAGGLAEDEEFGFLVCQSCGNVADEVVLDNRSTFIEAGTPARQWSSESATPQTGSGYGRARPLSLVARFQSNTERLASQRIKFATNLLTSFKLSPEHAKRIDNMAAQAARHRDAFLKHQSWRLATAACLYIVAKSEHSVPITISAVSVSFMTWHYLSCY